MKKLFILFLAMGLLAACNNSNPFTKNTSDKEKKEKDDRKGTDELDDKTDKKKDDYTDDDNSRSNWTSSQRDKWLNECIDASGNNPNGRKVCSCVLDKLEKKYPDSKDAENATADEATRLAKECMADLGNNTGTTGGDDEYQRQDRDDVTRESGSWTNLQRKQFIQGCATTAQRAQGFTAEQANTYCDCMTRKVEKKYTFNQAARLKAEDLQTQEWLDAVEDCKSRF